MQAAGRRRRPRSTGHLPRRRSVSAHAHSTGPEQCPGTSATSAAPPPERLRDSPRRTPIRLRADIRGRTSPVRAAVHDTVTVDPLTTAVKVRRRFGAGPAGAILQDAARERQEIQLALQVAAERRDPAEAAKLGGVLDEVGRGGFAGRRIDREAERPHARRNEVGKKVAAAIGLGQRACRDRRSRRSPPGPGPRRSRRSDR